MAGLNLPKGTSMNHTIDSLKCLTAAVEEQEGIKGIIGIAGVDILSGTPQSDAGILDVALEEWDEREKAQASLDSIMEQTDDTAKRIVPEAEVFLVNPPSIYGLSSTGGISMYLQDVTGHTDEELLAVVQEVTAAMEEREELAQVEPEFSVAFPYMDFSVDEDKVKEMGVSLADVYQTMQVNFGGEEVNNFTRFGQVHKVVLQGDAPYRIVSGALDYLFVRNEAGKNVPLATLVQAAESTGPVNIARYNGLHSIYFEAMPKDGYSLGEAMDAMEEAVESSAAEGFRIAWAGESRHAKAAQRETLFLLGFSLLCVFLCLVALYESLRLPFVVLLSVPVGIGGALFCAISSHAAFLCRERKLQEHHTFFH